MDLTSRFERRLRCFQSISSECCVPLAVFIVNNLPTKLFDRLTFEPNAMRCCKSIFINFFVLSNQYSCDLRVKNMRNQIRLYRLFDGWFELDKNNTSSLYITKTTADTWVVIGDPTETQTFRRRHLPVVDVVNAAFVRVSISNVRSRIGYRTFRYFELKIFYACFSGRAFNR